MLSTDQKGNVAEQAFVLTATKLGLEVYRPIGEGSRYDLILAVGGRLVRVQCKWAPRKGDVVALRCCSTRRTRDGLHSRRYTSDEIDAFGAYCPDTDRCYLVPIERLAGQRDVFLRLEPTKNGQRGAVIWAHEFELSGLDCQALGAVAQLAEHLHGMQGAGGSSPPSSTSSTGSAPLRVGAHEFRNHFGWYVDRAAAGNEFLVTRRGKPHLRLLPA